MSQTTSEVVENADIDRDTPQPQIHVEERRLKLKDFGWGIHCVACAPADARLATVCGDFSVKVWDGGKRE